MKDNPEFLFYTIWRIDIPTEKQLLVAINFVNL